jgi:hypothetical protein
VQFEPGIARSVAGRRVVGVVAAGVAAATAGCGHSAAQDRRPARPAVSLSFLERSVRTLRMTTRVSPKVTRTCAAATRQTTVPVYCPRLVPQGPIGHVRHIPDRDLFGPVVFFNARDLYQLSFNNGVIRGHQHWIVGAGRAATVRRLLIEGVENDEAKPAVLVARRRLAGYTVSVYRFSHPGGGMHAGHIGAFVARGGLTVFATLHGYAHADAAAAMAVDLATAPPVRARTSRRRE